MDIKSLTPYVDRILHYKAYPWQGFTSACRVRIFLAQPTLPELHSGVIVTELPENSGTSVTNAAETIATLVVRQYGLDPAHTVWVEHYPDRHPLQARCEQVYDANPDLPSIYDESFDLLTFEWDGEGAHHPKWTRITPEAALDALPCCARDGGVR
jgi:hypothetical protein